MSSNSYRKEIEALHEFFVEWYTGTADKDEFDTVEDALAPSFEIVTPAGKTLDREAIVGHIRDTFDTREPGSFSIDIRNVEIVGQDSELALVRYEEWQEDTEGTNGRLSTALFAPARGSTSGKQRYEWRHLQETWLEH